MIHFFESPIDHIELPDKFTCPFHYIPHPLCIIAAKEVQEYLSTQTRWQEELQKGKMFGVLIVRTPHHKTGYLAAFSGNLAGKNTHPFFVPPVYDLLAPQGFFKMEEARISAINARIKEVQADAHYQDLLRQIEEKKKCFQNERAEARNAFKNAKETRKKRRETGKPDEAELAAMIKESQFQKAELKRLEHSQKAQLAGLQKEAALFTDQVEQLKSERKKRSAALQQKLFGQFRMLNARGEEKDLYEIFKPTVQKVPPAGAGECAAPKLLQYAYLNHLIPVAMAEFWWGDSPKTEIRHHGYYYPACKGKCEPILKHMLQGLEVEENPLLENNRPTPPLETIYEDDYLLVFNKPAGMLSVPGKENTDSVYKRIRAIYPEASGPLLVHRLDMSTSGLLLVAKTKEIHQKLQAQFENRTVKKRYIALLDGNVSRKEGVIDLPLCPDFLDRPRQMVNREHGKTAVTHYQVLKYTAAGTFVAFYPLTGRTHQLRVHSAHPEGLHCPILGDELYGRKADRLYLHAESLEFIHPVTNQVIHVEKKADFYI